MYKFDISLQGTCLVCVGHSNGACWCLSESLSAHHFLNSQATQDMFIEPHPEQTVEQPNVKVTYKRLKKDNIAYKHFDVLMANIYQKLTGKKIDANYKKLYCRKEYFVVILSLLEREGKVQQAKVLFLKDLSAQVPKLERKHESEPQYVEQLKISARDRERAFAEFQSGQVQLSLKSVFDYQNMRHKAKFQNALKSVQKVRKDMCLSF